PTLPSRLTEAEKLAPELAARVGSIADQVALPVADDVPVWRGELRSAARAHLLPGVYSTRVHQKRERARVEALVERYAEPLSGLGWAVDAPPLPPSRTIVPVVEGNAIVVDAMRLRFLDEPDVGDLYNFCPTDGAEPKGPASVRAEGQRVFMSFDGVEIALRLS